MSRFSLLLACLIAPSGIAQNQTIRCEGDWCLVPVSAMQQLLKDAETGRHYAELCKWVKP